MKKNQVILAIDSSTQLLQLGLLIDETITCSSKKVERGHAEIIFIQIANLLDRGKITYDDLTRIAVITGPGSFTGLRAGIAAARSIGFAKKIPTIGVPTMLALSLNIKSKKPFSIQMDARRGEFYYQKFSATAKPISDEQVISNKQIVNGDNIFTAKNIDIGFLARFAASVSPDSFLAIPNYVRKADAKTQSKHIITKKTS